jgi:polar amino acid transport system substrate-binding protein
LLLAALGQSSGSLRDCRFGELPGGASVDIVMTGQVDMEVHNGRTDLLMRSFAVSFLVLAMSLAPIAKLDARTLQQVLNVGTLRVGIVIAPPWTMRDSSDEFAGFEVDVATRLAADLEVDPEFVLYQFDELIKALESGEIDIVISGLTITPERALHVNFSRPYSVGGIGIATNLAATEGVERFEDLSNASYRVGVIVDSTAAALAERLLPNAELITFDEQSDAADALLNGNIDVYLDEEPAPTFLALRFPATIDAPIARPLLETRSAFAIAKGDGDFLAYLNAWIESREADTWLPSTHRYWFNSLRWQER